MSIHVNDREITEHAILSEMQHHPAASAPAARQRAARALVVRELLLQEARRLGLLEDGAGDSGEEDAIAHLLELKVETPEPDDDSCRRYYRNQRSKLRAPDIYEVRHILVAADPRDPDARASARAEAEALIRSLGADLSRFGPLAAAHSACPSGATGGNLGQISPGQTVPEFERALKRLTPGELAARPIETRYGFHVVELVRRIDGRELAYDEVRERIATYLRESVRRRAISQYLRLLAGQAELRGIDMDGAESPLLQ